VTLRDKALAMLIARRPYARNSLEWAWRTRAAWTYLQMSMGKAPHDWTDKPPPVRCIMPASIEMKEAA